MPIPGRLRPRSQTGTRSYDPAHRKRISCRTHILRQHANNTHSATRLNSRPLPNLQFDRRVKRLPFLLEESRRIRARFVIAVDLARALRFDMRKDQPVPDAPDLIQGVVGADLIAPISRSRLSGQADARGSRRVTQMRKMMWTLRLKPGKLEETIAAGKAHIAASRLEPGCVIRFLCQC